MVVYSPCVSKEEPVLGTTTISREALALAACGIAAWEVLAALWPLCAWGMLLASRGML
eukprot:CAMPEP_0171290312 /NCGR_PEP_ID=MMETSP0790-20130122/71083_1 /TAXON_ID=2925 /ORGANISM="Alexandrium catenella, Strain OF101" /LENGTH=57 /DNA_ID=CAMNT_0011760023 /DNA_START=366 /DNA_END=539 /DNA_ORIENTATION=+